MFCRNCGTQINENEKFCSQCGTKNMNNQEESSSANTNNTDYEVNEKSNFIPNHMHTPKHILENKSFHKIIVALIILGLAYVTYNKHIETNRISEAFGNLQVKNYKILESEEYLFDGFNQKKEIVDYLVEGTLKDGQPVKAYIQYYKNSDEKPSLQYTTGGFTSCTGNRYNARYDFCNDE